MRKDIRLAALGLAHSNLRSPKLIRVRPARFYATDPAQQASKPAGPPTLRNALVAATVLGAAAVSYYYSNMKSPVGSVVPVFAETFTTRIRTSKGVVENTHELLSTAASEVRLHENASSTSLPANKSTSVFRYDTNHVASNEPIEDRHAEDALERNMLLAPGVLDTAGVSAGRGIKLFSIMDGHSGTATSQLLSKTLHPMIILSLRSLYAGHQPDIPTSSIRQTAGQAIRSYIASFAEVMSPFPSSFTAAPINPTTVSNSLISAFLTLDSQIVTSPLRLIPHVPAKPGKPNLRPIVGPMVDPALSGACAITMMVDEEREDLYVACTGDCRAVAGYWIEGKGWRCEVLTEDQMGRNPNEVKRMQMDHPKDERDTVIMRGRVQGGLEPTRAFGDARYKWTKEEHEGINGMLPSDYEGVRKPNPLSKTPPYVTARPEITYKKLGKEADGAELKFVVMATDGLWDRISSTEAVSLVGSHMVQPRRGPIPTALLSSALQPSSEASSMKYPTEAESPSEGRTGYWVYEDDNAATHLIRNSLAGADERKRRELLSLRYPVSRWLRDDVTCTVVFFGAPPSMPSQMPSQSFSNSGAPVKAKL